MSTAKLTGGVIALLLVAGILSVLLVGTAVHEAQAARRAQALLAAANQDYAKREERVGALEQAARTAEQKRAEMASQAEADRASAAAAAAAAGARATAANAASSAAKVAQAMTEGQKFLANFPRARALMEENGVPAALKIFAPFYRTAGLTASQVQQMENLMVSTWMNHLQITPNTMGGGTAMPTQDEVSAVIGPELAQQYQQFNDTMEYPYKFLQRVAAAAAQTGAPLSDGQNDQLAQIIASNSAALPPPASGAVGPAPYLAAQAAVNWENVLAQAKAVLPAAQFNAAQGQLLSLQTNSAVYLAQQAAKTGP